MAPSFPGQAPTYCADEMQSKGTVFFHCLPLQYGVFKRPHLFTVKLTVLSSIWLFRDHGGITSLLFVVVLNSVQTSLCLLSTSFQCNSIIQIWKQYLATCRLYLHLDLCESAKSICAYVPRHLTPLYAMILICSFIPLTLELQINIIPELMAGPSIVHHYTLGRKAMIRRVAHTDIT